MNKNKIIKISLIAFLIMMPTAIKAIGDLANKTTVNDYKQSLKYFYGTLDAPEDYLFSTNSFNCNETSCSESDLTDVGVLTEYEYNKIGGIDSYINPYISFYINSNGTIKELTNSGVKDDGGTSGLRPTTYLKEDTVVIGTGTSDDPYIISDMSDLNFEGFTLNGQQTGMQYDYLLENNVVRDVTCQKGTPATWDYDTNSININPKEVIYGDYCTINFKDGFTVTLTAGSTGTVSAPVSQIVGYNGTVTFTVTSNNEYTTLSKNTCLGTLSGNTYTISNIKENKDCEIEFGNSNVSLYSKLLEDNPTIGTRTDFSTPFTTNTANTLYKAAENGTDVYYFAGQDTESTPINNWVKFGKNSSGEDLYWRIIRTNADGSIRLLYHSTSTTAEDAYIGKSAYNIRYDDIKYAGYMYESNTVNSTLKETVDTWYKNNLTSYTKYLSNSAVYCNDRTSITTDKTRFGPNIRVINGKSPSYDCTNNEDKFTVDSHYGNGSLTYPVGLMTADELSFAGSLYGKVVLAWFETNSLGTSSVGTQTWWTLSLSTFASSNITAIYLASSSGLLGGSYANGYVVRPVISLKSDVLYSSGDGTSSNPYIISLDPDISR